MRSHKAARFLLHTGGMVRFVTITGLFGKTGEEGYG